MNEKKPQIPIIRTDNQELQVFSNNVKLWIDVTRGQNSKISTLDPNATLADVISKVNEIINRLQS